LFTKGLISLVKNVKAFGLQKSTFGDKYSMGFVVGADVAELMSQIFSGVRGGVLANFATILPSKTGSILSRTNEEFRKKYNKEKGEARDKLARETHAKLDPAARAAFDAEADRELDDIMRYINQKDKKGGFVSASDRNPGEFIVNAEAYPTRGDRNIKGIQFHDAAHENPKLDLDVYENGRKLPRSSVWAAVCKESPLGKNPIYAASAMLVELKKIHVKSDNTSISLGWSVVTIYKTTEEAEELDLEADEPVAKRTKPSEPESAPAPPSPVAYAAGSGEQLQGEEFDLDDERI
jgi:hypothetical protein